MLVMYNPTIAPSIFLRLEDLQAFAAIDPESKLVGFLYKMFLYRFTRQEPVLESPTEQMVWDTVIRSSIEYGQQQFIAQQYATRKASISKRNSNATDSDIVDYLTKRGEFDLVLAHQERPDSDRLSPELIMMCQAVQTAYSDYVCKYLQQQTPDTARYHPTPPDTARHRPTTSDNVRALIRIRDRKRFELDVDIDPDPDSDRESEEINSRSGFEEDCEERGTGGGGKSRDSPQFAASCGNSPSIDRQPLTAEEIIGIARKALGKPSFKISESDLELIMDRNPSRERLKQGFEKAGQYYGTDCKSIMPYVLNGLTKK